MRLPSFAKTSVFPPLSHLMPQAGEASLPETEAKLERVCRICRTRRRGAAAVEFALIAPLFFFLVIGMIEFGRAVMVQQILTNASREGARLGVLDGTTRDQVVTSVQNYLNSAGINTTNANIDPQPHTWPAGYGQPVTVDVTIPFGDVSWVPLPKIPFSDIDLKSKSLSASTVMRRETVQ